MKLDDLRRAADAALLRSLRPGLRASIDALLAAGMPAADILARVRQQCAAAGMPGSLTLLGVEVYLEGRP